MERLKSCLNRNQIKLFAIIVMVLDHLHPFVADGTLLYYLFRVPSRITGASMAFFIVEGYQHTHNIKKYLKRLFLFSLISWPFYLFYEYGNFKFLYLADGLVYDQPAFYLHNMGMSLVIGKFGVFSTLFCCLLAVIVVGSEKLNTICKIILVLIIMWASLFTDWSWVLVAYSIIFYVFRDDHKKMWIAFSAVALLYCFGVMPLNPFMMNINFGFQPYRLGSFLLIPLLECCYNHKPGRKSRFNQYFFYLFYPLHHLILGILIWLR